VVVIDPDHRIRVWNRRAEDLWGIRSDEAVGMPFLGLEIGLPVAELAIPIRQVMSGERSHVVITVRSTTRRGKAIDCLVSATSLTLDRTRAGVVLIMDDTEQTSG
jgi:two-component system CheB/CheR fusion protein